MNQPNWKNPGGVLQPPKQPTRKDEHGRNRPVVQDPATVDTGAPTPDEVAAKIQADQDKLDAEHGIAPQSSVTAQGLPSSSAPQPPEPKPEPPPRVKAPVVYKHGIGAFLKIPGGFGGRVVGRWVDQAAVETDPDVIAAGGLNVVLRGPGGARGKPSVPDQRFYRCTSNAFDYDLVVGELDAHLVSPAPEPR